MNYSLVLQTTEKNDFRYGPVQFKEIGFKNSQKRLGIVRLFTTPTEMKSQILLILGIPKYLLVKDFLKLIQKFTSKCIYLREIQDSIENRRMILLKFQDESSSVSFYEEFNGKKFNSFEPEVCSIAYVNDIVVEESETIAEEFNLKKMMQDITFVKNIVTPASSIELPTCVVCLERLDSSITGLFTTLCLHTFHCNCIMRWGDSACPVCRFSSAAQSSDYCCSSCDSHENLWICLICGNVGCGRYFNRHAFEHFSETEHRYAMEAESQRVWDYSGDNYVHRIIQNNDGKLVQLPPRQSAQEGLASGISLDPNRIGMDLLDPDAEITPQDILVAQKLESLEFSSKEHALSRQLQKTEMQTISTIESFENKLNELELYCGKLQSQLLMASDELQQERIQCSQWETKYKKSAARVQELAKTIQEEQQFNQALRANQSTLREEMNQYLNTVNEQKKEIDELKEQIRDLMFFVEAREKVGQMEELNSSSIISIGGPSNTTPKSTPKSKKKKR
jgi:BRCA1-associated protein